jgi:hypothetical protein
MQCNAVTGLGLAIPDFSLVLCGQKTYLQGYRCLPKFFISRYTVTQHDGSAHGGMGDFTGTTFFFPSEGDTGFDDPGYWNQMHRSVVRERCLKVRVKGH